MASHIRIILEHSGPTRLHPVKMNGRDLAETEAEILKWMVSTIGTQTVVIIGAVLTLMRMVPR